MALGWSGSKGGIKEKMAVGFSGSKGGIQSKSVLESQKYVELFKVVVGVKNGCNKLPQKSGII